MKASSPTMIETMLGEGGGEVAEEDNEEKRR